MAMNCQKLAQLGITSSQLSSLAQIASLTGVSQVGLWQKVERYSDVPPGKCTGARTQAFISEGKMAWTFQFFFQRTYYHFLSQKEKEKEEGKKKEKIRIV